MDKGKASPAPAEEKPKLNRQEFLNLAWLASLGFLTVNIAGITFLFSLPRFRSDEFGGTIPIGTVAELPAVGTPPVNYPSFKFWLTRSDKGVLAIYKVCTHLGCLYAWSDQEDRFICPCHGSQFEYDGTFIKGPAPRSLDRFVVQLVDPNTDAVLAESTDGEPLRVPEDPNFIVRVATGQRVNGKPHS
jgi:cytochrome b6-f complex iron-sulfur subunit